MKDKQLSTVVDKAIYYKARYVAGEENRTVSGMIRYLLTKHIRKFESKKGTILYSKKLSNKE